MARTYEEHLTEDRRLALLRLLRDAGGSANESVLHAGLQELGHRRGVTRELVRADLEFLASARLVGIEFFRDIIMVATLKERGLNVADGHEKVEGVKQPSIV